MDRRGVEKGPVAAVQILDPVVAVEEADLSVLSAHGPLIEHDGAIGMATKNCRFSAQVEPLAGSFAGQQLQNSHKALLIEDVDARPRLGVSAPVGRYRRTSILGLVCAARQMEMRVFAL
jgi:hypothetical protein